MLYRAAGLGHTLLQTNRYANVMRTIRNRWRKLGGSTQIVKADRSMNSDARRTVAQQVFACIGYESDDA